MATNAKANPNTFKWIKTAITLLVPALAWIIPSNVAYLIAQNRHVLLGRYSVGHLTLAFILLPIAAASLYLTWANEKNERQRQFKVLAITISIFFSLAVMDIAARLITRPKRYVQEETYFHRPPNTAHTGTARDVPEEAFLYPKTPPGYPDIEYTLTTDKRGFRNTTDLQQYDTVILGDSFAEGSMVTDQDAWPVILAKKTELTTYNLGMSAGHPGTYFQTLKKFGPQLSPKTVICLIYEGNDFRDSNYRKKDTLSDKIEDYFKKSPIRNALKNLLIRAFGSAAPAPPTAEPNRTSQPSPNPKPKSAEPLSWLPVAVPAGPNANFYAFKIKRLLEHFVTKETFLESQGAKKTFAALRDIKNLCNEKNIRLIIAYAPDKPHLLIPLITEIVPPEQLRAFMALRQKKLPPADKLIEALLARHSVQESAIEDFCRTESIEFLSLTAPLRKATADATQTYFTYDQHWTPLGHKIVAESLSQYIAKPPAP